MSEVQPSQSSGNSALVAWDSAITEIAHTSEFILGDRFETEEGRALARVLAEKSWPSYRDDRVYAKAGDNSNEALRALERKYHAALRLLSSAGGTGQ